MAMELRESRGRNAVTSHEASGKALGKNDFTVRFYILIKTWQMQVDSHLAIANVKFVHEPIE